jgi:hypothetical protein
LRRLGTKVYLRGYRVEEWSRKQLDKCFTLPIRGDFYFKLSHTKAMPYDSIVAVNLPVYLSDASLMGPDHKDQLSGLAGACKRLAAEVNLCSFNDLKRILLYSRQFIHPNFGTFANSEVPETMTWIQNINHPDSRKKELILVYEDILKEGVVQTLDKRNENPTECKSFIKDEKYDDLKPPRWINSSLDVVKVIFGPIADKCMEKLCEHPAMIKVIPVAERAAAINKRLGGGIAQSSDATAMEDHYANIPPAAFPNAVVNDPRYRISNELMLHMCGGILVPPDLLKAVKFIFNKSTIHIPKAFRNRLFSRIEDASTLKAFFEAITDTYRRLQMRNFGYVLVNGILASGEMNTSFKNSSSMHVMVNFAAYDLSGGEHPYCNCFNEGDDALAAYHGGLGPDVEWWLKYGWVVKVEFTGLVNEASFCGLVYDPQDLVSVPDIRKTLAKFGWTNRRYVGGSHKLLMALLRSKAMSMMCEYAHVPIIGALAKRLLFLTKGIQIRKSITAMMDMYERERYFQSLKQRPWSIEPNPGFGTRALVCRLQNIPVSVQLRLEKRFETLELGELQIPELDFDPVWIHSMTRVTEQYRTPRCAAMTGRVLIVDRIKDSILEAQERTECMSHKKVAKMFKQLDELLQGSITTR